MYSGERKQAKKQAKTRLAAEAKRARARAYVGLWVAQQRKKSAFVRIAAHAN